jgi:hypothetical protein
MRSKHINDYRRATATLLIALYVLGTFVGLLNLLILANRVATMEDTIHTLIRQLHNSASLHDLDSNPLLGGPAPSWRPHGLIGECPNVRVIGINSYGVTSRMNHGVVRD